MLEERDLFKGFFIKIFIVLYLIVKILSVAVNVIKLVREFNFKADFIFIKVSFGFFYVMEMIQIAKSKNQRLIMDQGISQLIWSCIFHGNNVNYNFYTRSPLLLTTLSKMKLNVS